MPDEQPRITTTEDRPDEVLIHLPEFTYWDTQAWSAELGIPASALPALRDAIDQHATPAGPDPAANPLREAVTAALRTTPATASADWPASSPHRTGPDARDGHAYDARCALCAGDVDALTQAVVDVRDRETERLRGEYERVCLMLHASRDVRAQAEAEVARLTDLMGRYADRGIANGQRAEAAEVRLAAVRALGSRLATGTEPFARAWGEELLGVVDADGGTS